MSHWRSYVRAFCRLGSDARPTRYGTVLVLGLLVGVVASALQFVAAGSSGLGGASSPVAALDAAAQDRLLRLEPPGWHIGSSGAVEPAGDPRRFITLIAIDERTIEELGAYNGGYPRRYHAQVVESLLAAPPRVIAFDLGFFEPTPDDAQLAAAFDHARSLPVPTSIVLGAVGLVPQGRTADRAPDHELVFNSSLKPVPLLAERADLALANIVPDGQGTIRSMPMLAYVDGIERPTLALAAMARYLRRANFFDGRDGASLELAGRSIPLERDATLRIDYFGPPSEPYGPHSTFRVVSFVDVLRGRIDPAVWRGGLVIIGALGATGLADDYWTPTSDEGHKMAGAEIHANVAADLFSTRFLRDAPLPLVVVLNIAIAVLVALLAARLGALAACAASGLVVTAYLGVNVWELYTNSMLLPFATPLLAGLVSFSGSAAYGRAVEQRRALSLRAEVAHVAHHDALTGLPNRQRFQQCLTDEIQASSGFGLLLLDLDRFKDINETLGHQAGDIVLRHVARRLREATPSQAMLARLGGDEFAVLLPGADASAAARAGSRLIDVLKIPMLLEEKQDEDEDQHEVLLEVSIGVVVYPEHGDDPGTLLRHAELAMYAAKRHRGGWAVFTPDQDQEARERLALVGALRSAVDRDELDVYFQPKIDCRSLRPAGVEVLLRWHHPAFGDVPPERFIPLAEETGLIGHLTRWALNAALRECRTWMVAGLEVPVAVNLSALDAQDPDLPDAVADLLARWDVPAARLMLELTEGALLADRDRALDVLRRLDTLGVHAALDDFGAGYSSLGYLKQFPVHELKIDRSLVGDIVHEARDRAIVRSTVELAHSLGLVVVAEGVEDPATLDLLRALGCDLAQGYYLGRPMPASELTRWLRFGGAAAA